MQKVTTTYLDNMCDIAPNAHVGILIWTQVTTCILPIIPHTKSNNFVFCKRQPDYTTILGIKMLAQWINMVYVMKKRSPNRSHKMCYKTCRLNNTSHIKALPWNLLTSYVKLRRNSCVITLKQMPNKHTHRHVVHLSITSQKGGLFSL